MSWPQVLSYNFYPWGAKHQGLHTLTRKIYLAQTTDISTKYKEKKFKSTELSHNSIIKW